MIVFPFHPIYAVFTDNLLCPCSVANVAFLHVGTRLYLALFFLKACSTKWNPAFQITVDWGKKYKYSMIIIIMHWISFFLRRTLEEEKKEIASISLILCLNENFYWVFPYYVI